MGTRFRLVYSYIANIHIHDSDTLCMQTTNITERINLNILVLVLLYFYCNRGRHIIKAIYNNKHHATYAVPRHFLHSSLHINNIISLNLILLYHIFTIYFTYLYTALQLYNYKLHLYNTQYEIKRTNH